MSDHFGRLVKAAQSGDQRALAELLTWVEQAGASALNESGLLRPRQMAFRIGITGPPGAGKSTLVGQLIKEFRQKNLKVGVLAVDPSSPFTRGAILGDRIRYNEHTLDKGVFIRSIGTRGSLGGLSAAAYLMVRVFDAVGLDVVLIETVGVGQTELEIMNVADKVVVVLVPESGDSVQAMKAGLLEIADLFVVNKSDRPGADSMKTELEFIAETAPEGRPRPEVLTTVATMGSGLAPVMQALETWSTDKDRFRERRSPRRLQLEARALLRQKWEDQAEKQALKVKSPPALLKVLGVGSKPKRKTKPRRKTKSQGSK